MTAAGPRHAAGGGPGIRLRVVQLGVLLGERYRVRGLVGLPRPPRAPGHPPTASPCGHSIAATASARSRSTDRYPGRTARPTTQRHPIHALRRRARSRRGGAWRSSRCHGTSSSIRWRTQGSVGLEDCDDGGTGDGATSDGATSDGAGAIDDTGGDGGTTEVEPDQPGAHGERTRDKQRCDSSRRGEYPGRRRPPRLVAGQDGRPAMVDGDAVRTGTRRSVGLVVPIASSSTLDIAPDIGNGYPVEACEPLAKVIHRGRPEADGDDPCPG